ncbi:ABC transporter substrate-binding protein, partial [bacterium]|nr:ABC transporter substrate-binding protein [bacterium]
MYIKSLTIICQLLTILLFCTLFYGHSYAGDKVTLQLPWHHQFQFAGYYAAISEGYYADAGLEVTVVPGSPGVTPVDEVMAGRAHYGVARSELVLHRQKGVPVVALAPIFQHSAITFLAREDSGISTIHDMIGKTVMMIKGGNDAEHIAAFLNEGVSLDQINLIPSSYDINDLVNGKTDVFNAYISNEPFFLQELNIPVSIIRPSSYGIDFYGDTIFTSEDTVTAHPEQVKAFRDATLKGWAYALANQEKIIDLIINKYKVKKSRAHLLFEAKAINDLIMPDLIQIGHINPGRWKHIADTYVKLGMADPGYSLDNFIYDPDPHPDYSWVRWTMLIAGIVFAISIFTVVVLGFFNRRLQKEILERKKAETAKDIERKRLYSLLDTLPAFVYLQASDYSIRFANKYYKDHFGETEGVPCHKSLWGRDKPCEVCPTFEVFHTKRPQKWEWDSAPDGLIYEIRDYPFTDTDGTELVFELGIDITKRKEVEEQLRRQNYYLEKAQEVGAIGTWEFDIEKNVLKWNNQTYHNFGVHVETLISIEAFTNYVYPEDRDYVMREWNAALKGKPYDIEHRIIVDGEIRWIREKALLTFDSAGAATYAIGLAQDITNSKIIEQERQKAQQLESIGVLAGGIAHDFNNLFAAILNNLFIAKLRIESSGDAIEMIDKIEKSILSEATNLTHQLITFSRGGEPVKEVLSINEIIRDNAGLALSDSSIRCEFKFADNLWPVEADKRQIAQVVQNLITNAVQAMPDGGDLKIDVENCEINLNSNIPIQAGRYVKIILSDTGCGISAAHISRIYDPYFSTKELGRGLGLAVCYSIIKRHEGHISVKSKPGKLTTFTIYFPVTEKLFEQKRSSGTISTSGIGKVLIMDDEEQIRDSMGDDKYALWVLGLTGVGK